MNLTDVSHIISETDVSRTDVLLSLKNQKIETKYGITKENVSMVSINDWGGIVGQVFISGMLFHVTYNCSDRKWEIG